MAVSPIKSPSASHVDDDNPWPGLAAFREMEHGYFRGREAKTRELVAAVERARLTILHGLSGLGKTSLLQAGLFPRLGDLDIVPIHVRLSFLPGAPDLVDQIKAAIPAEIRRRGGEAPSARADQPLWTYFHRRDSELWTERNRPAVALIAIDQFEELFTLGRDHPGRPRLIAELAELIEARVPSVVREELDGGPDRTRDYAFDIHPYKVLLVLREDYLSELEDLKHAIPSLSVNRIRLGKMNGEDARAVVRIGRSLVDPDAEDPLLRFVAGPRTAKTPIAELEIDPALLSVLCRELNDKRRTLGDARITVGLLDEREEILSGFYDRAFEGLAPSVREFVEDSLITEKGFRNPQAIDNALGARGMSQAVIDALVERRLIRLEERGGTRWLELTHDVLTGVVQRRRDGRRGREAAQAALDEAQRETEKVVKKAEETDRRRRSWVGRFVFYALGGMALLMMEGYIHLHEQRQRELSGLATALRLAVDERANTNQKQAQTIEDLDREKEALKRRGGAAVKTLGLLQDVAKLDGIGSKATPPADADTFMAESKAIGPDSSGKMIYAFKLRLRKVEKNVVGVFYQILGEQPRLGVGIGPNFEATFQLWSCRLPGAAVVSYEDVDPMLVSFDLCDLVKRGSKMRNEDLVTGSR